MKEIELTRNQLIARNRSIATFCLKNCPKTYRIEQPQPVEYGIYRVIGGWKIHQAN